jgi:tRNA nucleotidyltransferase (CCA-adding enzyme)
LESPKGDYNSLSNIEQFVEAIRRKGGQIYLVGGPVRDSLLEMTGPKDLDIIVCKLPIEELKVILNKYGSVYLVGQSFGVIKFKPFDSEDAFDIALPRKEQSTGTGHRDFEIDFDPWLPIETDLGRRDFTINAMAREYPAGNIIDPYNGRTDLANKTLRMVSATSFPDDPLRMLRGIQFAARFDLAVEENTLAAMVEYAPMVKTVSPERIADELNKLLLKAKRPSVGFRLMNQTGLLQHILPELAQAVGVTQPGGYHRWDVFEHTLRVIDYAPPKLIIRLAALFHDSGKPSTRVLIDTGATFYGHDRASKKFAEEALKRLRYSNEIIDQVCLLVHRHMFSEAAGEKGIRRLINKTGPELIFDLIELRRADTLAQGMGQDPNAVDEYKLKVEDEIRKNSAFAIKDLQINGNDIKESLELQEGPLVGDILKELLDKVLDEPEINSREKLLELAREIFRKRQLDF